MSNGALVVGVGRTRLGDDAVGIEVADRLRKSLAGLARVIVDASTGWEALNAIEDERLLVLIDAAQENEQLPVGSWRRFEFPNDQETIVKYSLRDTHTMSVDSMLRMGRALDWLPSRVWIYVIAGRCFQPETDLSPSIAAIIEPVAAQIETDIRSWLCHEHTPRNR